MMPPLYRLSYVCYDITESDLYLYAVGPKIFLQFVLHHGTGSTRELCVFRFGLIRA